MLVFILLYLDAGWLQHSGKVHIPIWAWFIPILFPIFQHTSNTLFEMSKVYPIISLPFVLVWGYTLMRILARVGAI